MTSSRRPLVAISDCNFGPYDIEFRELAKVDAEVVTAQCTTEQECIDLCREVDGVLIQYAPFTRKVIAELKNTKVLARYGIGVDNIDVAAATEHGIIVANVPGFCVPEVTEHTLAMMLALHRRLFRLERELRSGGWNTVDTMVGTTRLNEQTLGVIGFGAIGRDIAVRSKALGLRVLAYSPSTTPEVASRFGAESASVETILRESDYVSLHLPVNQASAKMIDAAALAKMKPSAFLINTSRGGLVDQAALIDALKSGRIAGAALDVFEKEPIPAGDPILSLENLIMTPHSGFYSIRSLEDLRARTARNVAEVMAGRPPLAAVNKVG